MRGGSDPNAPSDMLGSTSVVAPAALCKTLPLRYRSAVLLGQLISVLIAGTGVTSQYLSEQGFNAPTFQSILNYLLLTSLIAHKWWSDRRVSLKVAWWKYALLAVADVEANYFVVKAYQYTSITSVMLLDSWTIPCVMVLSRLILRAKFKLRHYFGVLLCLAGLVVLVFSDAVQHGGSSGDTSNSSAGSGNATAVAEWGHAATADVGTHRFSRNARTVLGDLLCVVGSTFYAVSNIGEEYVVKRFDLREFLGMIGLCGLVISSVQFAVLEREELNHLAWTPLVTVAFVGFAACLFLMYILTAKYMSQCDATAFNLSVLTSDLWALLFGVVLFHQHLGWLYFVAAIVVVSGIVTYNSGGPAAPPVPPAPPRHGGDDGNGDGTGAWEPLTLNGKGPGGGSVVVACAGVVDGDMSVATHRRASPLPPLGQAQPSDVSPLLKPSV